MGRPRSDQQSHEPPGDIECAFPALAQEMRNLPPRSLDDGRPNPEHYRARFSILNQLQTVALIRDGRAIPNYESNIRGLESECQKVGLDLRAVQDQRSDSQIAEDMMRLLLDQPDSIWEMTDHKIEVMTRQIDFALATMQDMMNKRTEEARGKERPRLTDEQIAELQRVGKDLRSRLKRVRRLRSLARGEMTPNQTLTQEVIEATEYLRFMVYVGRTDTSDMGADGTDIFQIARHHCQMALDVWEAENGIYFSEEGPQWRVRNYEGAIIIIPPGHGKSQFMFHRRQKRICNNRKVQAAIIHSKDDRASECLKYMSAAFKPQHAVGRRLLSLYPDLELADEDNNAKALRVRTDETQRAPTLVSSGVKAAAQGINLTEIDFDDPVDEREADSATERDRVFNRMMRTWMPRLRGNNTFHLTMTTLWHEEDANSRRINMVKNRDVMIRVGLQAAGGPENGFKPVWPEVYGVSYLRKKFKAMGQQQYGLVYMCSPQTAIARIVNTVAFYDQTAPEHQEFLEGAIHHLSVDPTATTHGRSDMAGVVYAAQGYIRWTEQTPHGPAQKVAPRLRVLGAWREKASQSELAATIGARAEGSRVDYVHAETVGAFAGFAEMLEAQYGIDVIRHIPKPGANKGVRLRRVSVMLENSDRDKGIIPVVEFPASPDEDGRLILDESVAWLADQVMKFGIVRDDDGLDALTQLCGRLSTEMGIGEGAASVRVKQAVKQDSRLMTHIRSKMKEITNRSDDWRRREFDMQSERGEYDA